MASKATYFIQHPLYVSFPTGMPWVLSPHLQWKLGGTKDNYLTELPRGPQLP